MNRPAHHDCDRRIARQLSACALLALCTGCVQRVMHVRSDPPGAMVTLNDREIGRTPFDKEFLWYGDYDVVARLDGYRTLTTDRQVTAPWWQFVPFDLLTDFLPLRDDEYVRLTLEPLGPANPADVMARAGDLRQRLESSGNTTNRRVLSVRPAPQPTTAATRPATTEATTVPATTAPATLPAAP